VVWHDATSKSLVERHGGEVVKATGDGVLALLPSAAAAVGAGFGSDPIGAHELRGVDGLWELAQVLD
jgi:class 3 adenylate cyclase